MQPIDDAMTRRTLLDLALLRQRDRTDWEREDQVRRVAVRVLGTLGLLSEDIDTATHELWGNFPQTYSLVGIINAATRLSGGWEEVV